MASQQLIEALSRGLADLAQHLWPEARVPWGVIASALPDVFPDPLRCGGRPSLGRPSGQVWEAGLPADLVRDAMRSALGRLLGHAIGDLVAPDSSMCQDPPNVDLITSSHEPGGDLKDGSGPVLAWAQLVR